MSAHLHHEPDPEPSWMSAVLQFLDELARVVATESDLETTLNWIVQRLKRLMNCDEVCVRLRDPGARVTQGYTIAERREHGAGTWPEDVGRSVMGFVVGGSQNLITPDLTQDPRFPGLQRRRGKVRAAMVAPILVEGEIIGVLAATETEPGRQWTRGETWAFQSIAAHSGSAIEGVRLRELRHTVAELERTKEQLSRDNRHAARLQRSVIPSRPVSLAGWTIAGQVRPALEVGGDGFDVRRAEGERLCFTVFDVMGKGLPAAIIMVAVQALVREVCSGGRCIREAMERLERDITGVRDGTMVTLFYGDLDTSSGRLLYHRAGHPCPMLRHRDGRIEELQEGSHPFGLGLDDERRVGEATLAPGDSLLIFSDGATDARSPDGRFFGEERLRQLLASAKHGCPEKTVSWLMRVVEGYRRRGDHQDDITVVLLEAPQHGAPPSPRKHGHR